MTPTPNPGSKEAMIPREAIQHAIEGRWKNYPSDFGLNEHYVVMHDMACITALDPSFWQALGKALGWGEALMALEYQKENGDRERLYWKGQNGHQYTPHLFPWQIHANRFYDLILTNGDTTAFWQELLAPKNN